MSKEHMPYDPAGVVKWNLCVLVATRKLAVGYSPDAQPEGCIAPVSLQVMGTNIIEPTSPATVTGIMYGPELGTAGAFGPPGLGGQADPGQGEPTGFVPTAAAANTPTAGAVNSRTGVYHPKPFGYVPLNGFAPLL